MPPFIPGHRIIEQRNRNTSLIAHGFHGVWHGNVVSETSRRSILAEFYGIAKLRLSDSRFCHFRAHHIQQRALILCFHVRKEQFTGKHGCSISRIRPLQDATYVVPSISVKEITNLANWHWEIRQRDRREDVIDIGKIFSYYARSIACIAPLKQFAKLRDKPLPKQTRTSHARGTHH